MDPDLLEVYKKEVNTALTNITSSLDLIKADHSNQKEIFRLYRAAHTIKSSSFQMGFYSVGYLAHLLNDLLKDIEIKKITIDEEKLAFIMDFVGSLKQAVISVLNNKESKINKKIIDRLNGLLEESEEKRLKAAELAIEEDIKHVSESKLEELYNVVVEKSLRVIRNSLRNLETSFNQKEIDISLNSTHQLEGNSLQMAEYVVAYFSSKLGAYFKEVRKNGKITKVDVAYLNDVLNTTELCINLRKGKKVKSDNKALMKKLQEFIKEDYDEIERGMMNG